MHTVHKLYTQNMQKQAGTINKQDAGYCPNKRGKEFMQSLEGSTQETHKRQFLTHRKGYLLMLTRTGLGEVTVLTHLLALSLVGLVPLQLKPGQQ